MDATTRIRKRLTVVVPVFNEIEVLPRFWTRMTSVLDQLAPHVDGRVLFVDDGSRDGSMGWLTTLAEKDKRACLIVLSRNFGKEVALSAGLDNAEGDWVAIIDADLQDPPELIPTLLGRADEGFDVVYARRTRRRGETWAKRATAAAFYRVMGRLCGRVQIPADTGDFRVLSRRAVLALRQFRERHRFMKGLFAWIGFPSAAVDYERDSREAGASHFGFWRLWNFALDGITGFSTAPLKAATYLGGLVALAAFGFGAWIVIKTLVYGESVRGYPTIMVTLLFFSGVQLLFVGVIGEYLARMFDEAKQRPLYFVRHAQGVSQADLAATTALAPSVSNRALVIADEAMIDVLRCHAVPIDVDQTRFGLCDEYAGEVARLELADPAIIEAFSWLSERGLAKLVEDASGTSIQLIDANS